MSVIGKINNFIYDILKSLIPKKEQVIIDGGQKADANAIELANYIATHYNIPVYYYMSPFFEPYAKDLLLPVVKRFGKSSKSKIWIALRTKYRISTHGLPETAFKNQTYVNLWHGVGHKEGKKTDHQKMVATLTVATSQMTKPMLADYFKIPESTVFISGYPRNDLMLRMKNHRKEILSKLKPDLTKFDKIIIWLPTFRITENLKYKYDANRLKFSDFFQYENFDVIRFNELLKKNNTICIMKPHPIYKIENFDGNELSHILTVDDQWLYSQGITLYHLLACTDALITDFSSVMTDYTLLEKPVLLFTNGFEDYKNNEGFYFEDVENYFPSDLIKDQNLFFETLDKILKTGEDPNRDKRIRVRDLYFDFADDRSSERLCKFVLNQKMLKK